MNDTLESAAKEYVSIYGDVLVTDNDTARTIAWLDAHKDQRVDVYYASGHVLHNTWIRHRANTHHVGVRSYRGKKWVHGGHLELIKLLIVTDSTEPTRRSVVA